LQKWWNCHEIYSKSGSGASQVHVSMADDGKDKEAGYE
jgi:hypothetical protein